MEFYLYQLLKCFIAMIIVTQIAPHRGSVLNIYGNHEKEILFKFQIISLV